MKVESNTCGLECGLICRKNARYDSRSIGSDMSRVHTIEERLSISSTIRVYKFLERVIEEKIL